MSCQLWKDLSEAFIFVFSRSLSIDLLSISLFLLSVHITPCMGVFIDCTIIILIIQILHTSFYSDVVSVRVNETACIDYLYI